ncbi:MAG: hypothetical protein KGH52_00600 [Candidatus Micrarchaeota archaeon]|nr:hypothetical protein [Candidatus Micrarchaeota archaeon]
MEKEWIFWIILIAVIVVASLYYRFYNTQAIAMSVSINSSATSQTLYPYQKVTLPITIQNTGSSPINRLNFEVSQSGNTSVAYEITLPPGKSVIVPYNFTPSLPGNYNISVVVDPAKLYNIVDRGSSQPSTLVHVTPAAQAAPYSLLPSANVSQYGSANIKTFNTSQIGLIGSTILFADYGIQKFAPVGQNNSFVYSIVNLTVQYTRNISTAYAFYDNGYYAYSTWMRGYITPDVFGIAAASRGYQTSNYTINGSRVTFVRFSNVTSGCAWYQKGWVEMLVYHGPSCIGVVNGTIKTLTAPVGSVNSTAYNGIKRMLGNFSLANFSQYWNGNTSYSAMTLLNDGEIATVGVSPYTSNNICFGEIKLINGTNFCSAYILQTTQGNIPKISLVRTSAFLGKNNLTVYSLINSSRWYDALPVQVGMISSLNLSGASKSFVSAYGNTCALNASFGCTLNGFYNGTAALTITNNLNSSVSISALNCFTTPPWKPTALANQTIAAHSSANLTAKCYEQGDLIFGVPVNLQLHISANYTAGGRNYLVSGNATANLFS